MDPHGLYGLYGHLPSLDFRTHVLYHNAMTYHLYRDLFTQAERDALDASSKDQASALSEINLLRIQLRRVFAAGQRGSRAADSSRRHASQRHESLGQTAHRESNDREKKSFSLASRLSMLATFACSGMIMASLVRFHLKYITSGLMYDPLDDDFPPGDVEDL